MSMLRAVRSIGGRRRDLREAPVVRALAVWGPGILVMLADTNAGGSRQEAGDRGADRGDQGAMGLGLTISGLAAATGCAAGVAGVAGAQIEDTKSDYDREKLQERLAKPMSSRGNCGDWSTAPLKQRAWAIEASKC